VVTALDASQNPIDRVWLAAFATEISLRDADNPVVAGAYAEIVAEHAPEHPVVREAGQCGRTLDERARDPERGRTRRDARACRSAERCRCRARRSVRGCNEAAMIDDDDVAELLDDNDLAAVIASANAAAPEFRGTAAQTLRASLPQPNPRHGCRRVTEAPKHARPGTDGTRRRNRSPSELRSDAHERAKRELLETPATILDAPEDLLPVEVDAPDDEPATPAAGAATRG